MQPKKHTERALDLLQKVSLTLMAVLIFITFAVANLQAALWQSSQWLVSTVLPAVVVELTNEERSDNDVQPLTRSATLDAAAKMKAEHMAKNEYFSHFAPDGTSPWYWFRQAGYNYAHAGENLAIHFTDSSEVVEAWMNSPTHRENIVNGTYTEIGVGTAKGRFDGHNTVYVVQLFGTPAATARATAPTPTPAQTETLPTQPESRPVVTQTEQIIESEVVPTPEPEPEPTPEPEPVPETESVLAAETPLPQAESEPVASSNEVLDPVAIEAPVVATATVPTEEISPVIVSNQPIITEDTVLLESTIATSSGLPVASVTELITTETEASLSGLATKPNTVLQIVYILLGTVVVSLLIASIVFEVRRHHVTQVIYGIGLLIIMVGLWLFHSYITAGAVII